MLALNGIVGVCCGCSHHTGAGPGVFVSWPVCVPAHLCSSVHSHLLSYLMVHWHGCCSTYCAGTGVGAFIG